MGQRQTGFQAVWIDLFLDDIQKSFTWGGCQDIYGLANFFEQGVFGRVGAGGLHAIKERQYDRTTFLSADIINCFQVLRAVINLQPRRQFPVCAAVLRRLRCSPGVTRPRFRRFPDSLLQPCWRNHCIHPPRSTNFGPQERRKLPS